jgi:hypothetical protein
MVELTKFTPTSKVEFEQLARDRKEDFDALREKGRWTASVYLGPYIVEARLKFKICDVLKLERLPMIFKTHDLYALAIYAGLGDELKSLPEVFDCFGRINIIHADVAWRYKVADPSHHVDSDNLKDWLFNPQYGVMTWLGL